MFVLPVQIREENEKLSLLREKGELAGILYGPKTKNKNLKLNYRFFEKMYKDIGSSSLISLELEGKKIPVLIQDIQKDPLTEKFLHIDFYCPELKEKTIVKIPLVFEGESLAVKNFGGTLVKNVQELEIKALPIDIPKEIIVSVGKLDSLEDNVLVKDLELPPNIEVLKDPEDIVVYVAAPEKVEEELEKPIEEKIEDVEKVEKKEAEEETKEATEKPGESIK